VNVSIAVRHGDSLTYRQFQFVPDFVEAVQLALHLPLALFPEPSVVGLFESNCRGLLQRADAGEADAGVCSSDILDQVLGPDQVAYPPTSSVEQLARTADSQSESRNLRAQRGNTSKRHVVQLVVDFVREDENVVLDAKVANGLELLAGEDLADRIVRCVDDDHAGAVRDLAFQLLHVECPLAGRRCLGGTIGRGVQRDVDDLTAGHLDVGDVLVEEGLEDNDFVALFEEAHEGGEHALIGAGGDGDFGVWVEGAIEGG